MNELAVQLKLLNLYSHLAHNMCAHSTFMQDHAFLGDLYEQADGDYDDIVERMIGLDLNPNIVKINVDAVIKLKSMPTQVTDNKEYFVQILSMLNIICQQIEALVKDPAMYEGTKQLIGEIANQTEITKYKVKQRIK